MKHRDIVEGVGSNPSTVDLFYPPVPLNQGVLYYCNTVEIDADAIPHSINLIAKFRCASAKIANQHTTALQLISQATSTVEFPLSCAQQICVMETKIVQIKTLKSPIPDWEREP